MTAQTKLCQDINSIELLLFAYFTIKRNPMIPMHAVDFIMTSIWNNILQARQEELFSRKRALQNLVNQNGVPAGEAECNKLLADMDKVLFLTLNSFTI